jgi:hypothetical protein
MSDLELREENAEGELKAQIASTRSVIRYGCVLVGGVLGFALYYVGTALELEAFRMWSPAITAVLTVGPMMLFARLASLAIARAVLRRRAREWAQQIAARHQIDVERIIHLAELWEH